MNLELLKELIDENKKMPIDWDVLKQLVCNKEEKIIQKEETIIPIERKTEINEHLIVRTGVRIFRPNELTKLINAIPKLEHKIRFETLLYTGCRYSEIVWLHKHPEAFDGNFISMPSCKTWCKESHRYIRLNMMGRQFVTLFLRNKRGLPAQSVWDRNLIRWAKAANLDSSHISSKSTRKTWESYLVAQYPNRFVEIVLSQGHTKECAMEFYLGMPFNDKDKEDMKFYTDGWI